VNVAFFYWHLLDGAHGRSSLRGHRFATHDDPALGEQFLHVAEAERDLK